MNILILDVYPDVDYRISKDQNGGYGTANNYGNTIFTKFLKFIVNKSIDFPPLNSVQVIGELKKNNHKVTYLKKIPKIIKRNWIESMIIKDLIPPALK